MIRPHIVTFTGSPQRPSKTRILAEMVAEQVSTRLSCTFTTLDLLDLQPALSSFTRSDLPSETEAALKLIETADALIVGSPVYKGSYAGQFKHVVDLLDPLSLAGKPVALVATGGGYRHALVVEHELRPLFGFFSALTLPTAVYASGQDFSDGRFRDDNLCARIYQLGSELADHLRNAKELRSPERIERREIPIMTPPVRVGVAAEVI